MKSILVKGLDTDQAKEIKGDFISSHLLRKRIVEVLNEKIEAKRTKVNDSMYESPNWANQAAHCFGYEAALKEVISILSEKDQ